MQESLDQLNKSRADETQLEDLKVELSRIKNMEPLLEKLKVISLSFNAVHSCVASFFCVFSHYLLRHSLIIFICCAFSFYLHIFVFVLKKVFFGTTLKFPYQQVSASLLLFAVVCYFWMLMDRYYYFCINLNTFNF